MKDLPFEWVEQYADNGEFSHWDLVVKAMGNVVLSFPSESKQEAASQKKTAFSALRMIISHLSY